MAETVSRSHFDANRKRMHALLEKYGAKLHEEEKDAPFSYIPEEELKKRRAEKRHVRAYYSQAYNYMIEHGVTMDAAFALVDEDGCLIRLKGTEELLSFLDERGIRLGMRFLLASSGANAISVGLAETETMMSAGEEHTKEALKDVAIYFSPLSAEDDWEHDEFEMLHFGGIVIFTRLQDANDIYLSQITMLASTLLTRLLMAYRVSRAFNENPDGMVMLDRNARNQKIMIAHHNEQFFEVLGLPKRSYAESYFTPVEDYFDPLPDNRRFWQIVKSEERVHEQDITLRIHGQNGNYVISSRPHAQPSVGAYGTTLRITTKERTSREISKKTANSAVMGFESIVAQSSIMRARIQKARLVANTDSNVMLLGESGVGKDLFAQAIHNMSSRSDQAFIAVNCGALPRDLIASELFGYEQGAFTGANRHGNIGKFELANGGTLFLDEIGELPLDLQATLLRAVEQKQFMRLGGSKNIRVDIKIIAATNADLTRLVGEKKFRADLYYRLNSMQIDIPPLRARGNDVILLAEHFIQRTAKRIGKYRMPVLSDDARQFLTTYPWYGNVRELQNVIDCVIQIYDEDTVTAQMLQDNVLGIRMEGIASSAPGREENPAVTVPDFARRETGTLTKEDVTEAIRACNGNRSKAADMLGVSRRTLYRYIDRLGL